MKLLTKLAKEVGVSVEELLLEATMDSVAWAICKDCNHIEQLEPDQAAGWCDNCEGNRMVSCLILAGLM